MIRKFLFEIIDGILAADDREAALRETISKNKQFADFMDLTFNQKYNWEFNQNYTKKARSQREKGGIEGQWYEIVRLARRSILKNTNESPKFMNRLDRALELCNQKDIQILLCAFKNRSMRYFHTKQIYKWFPEYLIEEDKNV